MLKVYKRKIGDECVLYLRGQLVTGEAATVRETVFAEANAESIVLDFGRVNRIDAGGLGLLLELREFARSKNIELKLINLTTLVRRVFEISCLDSVFDILPGRIDSSLVFGKQPQPVLKFAPC